MHRNGEKHKNNVKKTLAKKAQLRKEARMHIKAGDANLDRYQTGSEYPDDQEPRAFFTRTIEREYPEREYPPRQCPFYAKGNCRFGSRCRDAHGKEVMHSYIRSRSPSPSNEPAAKRIKLEG